MSVTRENRRSGQIRPCGKVHPMTNQVYLRVFYACFSAAHTLIVALLLTLALAPASAQPPRHGIAMHGEPALPADFSHFPYVNPQAPKSGRLILGLLGTFDSLNPF